MTALVVVLVVGLAFVVGGWLVTWAIRRGRGPEETDDNSCA